MSAHVFLNLLTSCGKAIKCGACRAAKHFSQQVYKFNNTGAQMFYHMTLKLIKNCILGVKTSIFCHLLCNVIMDVIR